MDPNRLYYGDNLDILRRYIKDEAVDLIYLDPPFNSNTTYNILFTEQNGTRSKAQVKAFEDTWIWDQSAVEAFQGIVESGGPVSQAMQAFKLLLGGSNMLAYLAMMAPRLVELERVLRPGGSIYLHCDPTASHYLKLLMDSILGADGFSSEIIWSYRRWPSKTPNYQHMHDVLLYYVKSGASPTFNVIYEPPSDSFVRRFKGKGNRLDPGATTKRATEEDTPGLPVRDVWEMSIISGSAKERLGYPTQKPEALLERIIQVSSNEGDLVLDPFSGCGTTVTVSQRLNRRWIGIDITHLAINLIKYRLKDVFGDEAAYKVVGEPVTLTEAEALAQENPYQFQYWALGLVGARPAPQDQKKGADRGIDGRLYFHDEPGGKTKQIVISVKGGKTNVVHIRDLAHVVEREQAEIGVLITLQDSTQPMRTEAAEVGYYDSPWGTRHPRLQILTIDDLLQGKRLDYPPSRGNVTFKKASRSSSHPEISNLPLPFDEEDKDE